MKSPIRTALVGFGSVAEKMHAPLIEVCQDLKFIGVVERNGNRCQGKYPNAIPYRSLNELLKADVADLISITTPNEFHFPMAKQCLLAGKHIVVDKPVTISHVKPKNWKPWQRKKSDLFSLSQSPFRWRHHDLAETDR